MYRVKKPYSIQTTSHSSISTPNHILVIGKPGGYNSLMNTSSSLSTNLASKILSLMHCLGAQIITKSIRFSFHTCVRHKYVNFGF